jgi:hypothetical protein
MTKQEQKFSDLGLSGRADLRIEWRDYDRIKPGTYPAYCRRAKYYWDPGFKRWTCLLIFDVFHENGMDVVARIPMWLSLGKGAKPVASRRSRYLEEWVVANGGHHSRGDRLSPRVFARRFVRVEVGDTTKGPVPYSVVKKILHWETGKIGLLSQQVTQSRTAAGKNGRLNGLQ